jgi:hypothetical protein
LKGAEQLDHISKVNFFSGEKGSDKALMGRKVVSGILESCFKMSQIRIG